MNSSISSSRDPNDPEIRWRMGQVAIEAGSLLFAARCFEASLALDPITGRPATAWPP